MTKSILIAVIPFSFYVQGLATEPVRLSELMIHPVVGCEWIELEVETGLNIGDRLILSDLGGRSGLITIGQTFPPDDLIIVIEDSTNAPLVGIPSNVTVCQPDHWPTLNDDGDVLNLSLNGAFIESVPFNRQVIPQAGHSLERISYSLPASNIQSWGECALPEGHTAGKANSLHQIESNTEIEFWADPNPFNPMQGDGFTYFHFILPSVTARLTIDLFTTDGRQVIRLASDLPAGTDSPIVRWNGKSGQSFCHVGRYVAVLRAFNDEGKSLTTKCSVVLVR